MKPHALKLFLDTSFLRQVKILYITAFAVSLAGKIQLSFFKIRVSFPEFLNATSFSNGAATDPFDMLGAVELLLLLELFPFEPGEFRTNCL